MMNVRGGTWWHRAVGALRAIGGEGRAVRIKSALPTGSADWIEASRLSTFVVLHGARDPSLLARRSRLAASCASAVTKGTDASSQSDFGFSVALSG
jgi:hypothetical protein